MTTVTSKDLKKACKKEKNPQVRARILAVNMVCMNNESIQHTADSLLQCPNWVRHVGATIQRGRHRRPRRSFKSGRPPKIELEKIAKIVSDADGSSLQRNSSV